MTLPRATGRRAAVLAVAAAVLAVLAVAAAAGRPAAAAAPARPAAAVTLARAALRAGIVPAVTAAPARPGTPAAGAVPLPGTGGCGLLGFGCDVGNAITGWFAGLVRSAVSPLLSLIGRTALSTPQPGSIAAVRSLWSTGLGIADACYGLLVLIGGIIVMSHETLQTSYSAKEIAPRIVTGFITANLSMVLISKAISLANGLSAAFTAAGGVSPRGAAASLVNTLGNSVSSGGIFLTLLALAGVVLALVLAAVYVIRLMAVVLLAAAAPLCLALYALPQTAWAARWWWRALTAALAIQVAQGLVLTAAAQVFLSPGWLPGGISTLGQTLITLCLLYILTRIPFWVARPVLSPFGRSPLRRAARFVVTAAVLSRVGPLLRGTAPASRGTAGRGGGGTRAGAGRAPGTGSGGWSRQASPVPPRAPRTPPGIAGGRPALPPAPPSGP